MERYENLKGPTARAIDLDLFINFFNKSSPETFRLGLKTKRNVKSIPTFNAIFLKILVSCST